MRMGRRTESTSKKKRDKAVAKEKKLGWTHLGSKYFETLKDFFSFEVHSKQSPVHFKTTLLIVSPTMPDSQTFKYSFQLLPQTPLYCVSTIKQLYCTLLWCSKWCIFFCPVSSISHWSDVSENLPSGQWRHSSAEALGCYQGSQYLGSLRNKGEKD